MVSYNTILDITLVIVLPKMVILYYFCCKSIHFVNHSRTGYFKLTWNLAWTPTIVLSIEVVVYKGINMCLGYNA